MVDLIPNRPSEEGAALGAQLARLTAASLEKLRAAFPKHAEPCQSCAFRLGTVPNRCTETVMDAMKCVMEHRNFMCHQSPKNGLGNPTGLCAGYMISLSAVCDKPPVECPWPFSDEGDDTTPAVDRAPEAA